MIESANISQREHVLEISSDWKIHTHQNLDFIQYSQEIPNTLKTNWKSQKNLTPKIKILIQYPIPTLELAASRNTNTQKNKSTYLILLKTKHTQMLKSTFKTLTWENTQYPCKKLKNPEE